MKTIRFFFPLLLLFLTACQGTETPQAPAEEAEADHDIIILTPAQIEQAGITVGPLETRELPLTLSCSGTIDAPPASRQAVHSPVMGFVSDLRHLPGEYVKQGTVLARIAHPDLIRLQGSFLESAAALPALQQDAQRQASLSQSDAASQKALEKAQSDLAITQARYNALHAELQLIGIDAETVAAQQQIQPSIALRSPVNGYLTEIAAQPGQLALPETPLFQILDNSHLHLELEVFPKDLPRLVKGQHVTARVPGKDSAYIGHVYLINRAMTAGQKTVGVHVHFDEEPVDLALGTFLFAEVQTGSQLGFALPESAIARSGDQAVVFVETEEGFRRLPVELGTTDKGLVGVRSPELRAGLRVVVDGGYYLGGQ